jgi:Winged helix DNA-binding domain
VDRTAANGLEPRLRGGVVDVVRRLCGVQAQDAAAARLAIRARSEGLTAADVDTEPGVVRTWGWRGTLHLLAREDVPWVLSLVAERANRSAAARRRALGLDEAIFARARAAVVERLADGPATRAQLREALGAAGVDAAGQRLPHLLRRVAFEGLLHHPLDGTFAALEPAGEPPPRERALAELARRHAEGYGPATAADLATFAGVSLAEGRAARAASDPAAEPAVATAPGDATGGGWVRLLGAFDPYLLGYAGRGHAVAPEHARKVWPGGGWIHPVVLVDGMAAATWRLDGGRLEVERFGAAAVPEPGLAAEAQDVGRFLGRAVAL